MAEKVECKKSYAKPELQSWGTVTDLTRCYTIGGNGGCCSPKEDKSWGGFTPKQSSRRRRNGYSFWGGWFRW